MSDDDFYRRFGEAVRFNRVRVGFSQSRLAEMAGCSRGTIMNLEQGRFKCHFVLGMDLARILEFSLRDVYAPEAVGSEVH